MIVKIQRIDSAALTSFVKNMQTMSSSVYLTLTPTKLISSVHTDGVDMLKRCELPMEEVFGFAEPLTEKIEVSFMSATKLLTCLGHFDQSKLRGEIHTFNNSDRRCQYAEKVVLHDGQLKVTLFCFDQFVTFTDEQLAKAMTLSNSSEISKFRLNAAPYKKMLALTKGMADDDFVEFQGNGDGIYIRTKDVEILVDDDDSQKFHVRTLKKFLNLFDPDTFDVKLNKVKMVLSSLDKRTIIIFNMDISFYEK